MKYLPLVWSGVWRRPVEAILVWLVVVASFTLFGLMLGLHESYDRVIASARPDRLEINARFPSASPTGILLPLGLRDQIARVPGVSAVGSYFWLWGYYQDPKQRVRVIAVDEPMRAAWTTLPVTPAQWQELFKNPGGILVSRGPAARLGLKRGDMLPVITPSGTRADGAPSWEFRVLDIVPDRVNDNPFILGNLKYIDNSLPLQKQGFAWGFRVAVRDAAQASDISVRIDHLLANSSHPTLTIPDRVSEIDAVNSGISVASKTWPVAGAGIFMILLLTANGIAQSVRERTPEFAVLKTIGFSNFKLLALVFAEVVLPCLSGAAAGLGLAAVLTRVPLQYLPPDLADLPRPTFSAGVIVSALLCALLLALVSTLIPWRRLQGLSVIEALGGH